MFDRHATKFIRWVGSPSSIIVHTIFFLLSFILVYLGIALEKVLLVLTTAVSLEAIYLAIFIQMTVNRNTESLEEVEVDIDEIQEDLDEIQENVEEVATLEQDGLFRGELDKNGQNRHEKIEKMKENLQKMLHELEEIKKEQR